jgi:hypothetical protein
MSLTGPVKQHCDKIVLMTDNNVTVSVVLCATVTGPLRAGLGPSEKISLGHPARVDWIKILTLNQKDSQLQSDLGLV